MDPATYRKLALRWINLRHVQMKRNLVLLVLGFVTMSAAATAETPDVNYTAETMMKLCAGAVADENPEFQSMVCTFRLQGVTEVMMGNCASASMGFQPAPDLSASKPPSRGAIRQAFLNYMEDHPEHWGLPWAQVAAMAISGSFPCEQI
jgi:hypothetical protein